MPRDRGQDPCGEVPREAAVSLALGGAPHRLSPQDPYARPWLPSHVAAQLVRYAWPGNIRELRNVTRQLVIESRGLPQLQIDPRLADQLGVPVRSIDTGPPRSPSDPASEVARRPSDPAIEVRRKPSDVSERELQDALRACAWDLKAAADRLRIPRPSIYDLIERSPDIRTASDIGVDEIARCFQACAGALDAMVAQLPSGVSARAQPPASGTRPRRPDAVWPRRPDAVWPRGLGPYLMSSAARGIGPAPMVTWWTGSRAVYVIAFVTANPLERTEVQLRG